MNAASPLTIETPDGSGEAVHPDVLFVPGGFAGHTHWLACTPYPRGDDPARAVRAAMAEARTGDLVLLPIQAERDKVIQLMETLSAERWVPGRPLP